MRGPVLGERPFGKRNGRILLVAFFDPNGIATIVDSIYAWQFNSRNEVVLINLWPGGGAHLSLPPSVCLADYDAVVVHPTVSYHAHNVENLDRALERRFAEYEGVKVLMKQDEQVCTNRIVNIIKEKKFDLVFTCVPQLEQEKVYPRALRGDCELVQVLTGYVSTEMRRGYERHTRDIDISYRGSIQPLEFGRLGYEKRGIGYDISAALARSDLRLNISSRWEDRVLGEEWQHFLSRSRAVLGVESGSNLFDFDGRVAQWCRSYEAERSGEDDPASKGYYRAAHEAFLRFFEDNVLYAQISPRHFEAAASGAAQILYDGNYSDVFRPYQHFMPLRRDLSNLDEIVDFLRDESARSRLAERAFEEVILNRSNWYESFVAQADEAIERRRESKGRVRRGASLADRPPRPVAYVLAAHDPVRDPRIGWFAESLTATHDVYVIGTYDFGIIGQGPTYRVDSQGITTVQVERTKHDAAWLLSPAKLQPQSVARTVLASLAGFAALPGGILANRIGAHGASPEAVARFRELCTYFVNTNSALMQAITNMGAPDIIVAADLETLPAATVTATEAGAYCVYDAHEYWPFSYVDFEYWEIEFWRNIDRLLSNLADLQVTVSEPLAQIMSRQYGCQFLTVPNCAGLVEGVNDEVDDAIERRDRSEPLKLIFLGNFAEGRGLEETLRAFAHVQSDTQLILQGPDNPYRRRMIELATSLQLPESRVSFPPAVTEREIILTAAKADVGLIPYNPGYFGYRYCCPNKLSQYLAAGLPILASETEYVSALVRRERVGFVANIADPIAYAATIDEINRRRSELAEFGRRARKCFLERYHWEAAVSPVLTHIAGACKPRSEPAMVDLSWIAKAPYVHQRHGLARALAPSVFGEGTASHPIGVLEPREQQSIAPQLVRQPGWVMRALRRVWRTLPASLRYPLAQWLRSQL